MPSLSPFVAGQMLVLPLLVAVGLYMRSRKPELFRPRRHGELSQRFWAMTFGERVKFLAVIAAVPGFILWLVHAREIAQTDILRRQLHIPPDVAISNVRVTRYSSTTRPGIEAIATFSKQQLEQYAANFDGPALWQPVLGAWGDIPIVSYSAKALRWMPLPTPVFAGDRRIRFGNVSLNADIRVRNGRVLCFALQVQRDGRQSVPFRELPSYYVAKACSEFDRREVVGTYMLAVLDYDTGKLHMTIR